MKVAVILFPGSNDHENSKRAAEAAGLPAEIVRWNAENIADYDGYILPGGWSYEDRIRAGVIAAKEAVMATIKEQATAGKPVLGICNGAQILVESGLVPGNDKVEMALAPNTNPWISGYYCTWVRLKAVRDTAFTRTGDTFRIPVAHGEGRFTTNTPAVLDGKITLQYCDDQGNVNEAFPITPNGSMQAIAGIANEQGNVLAMMPHPERSSWMRQVPGETGNDAGPCRSFFTNMKTYIEGRQ
ncbi:MAG: phosphoribosylformylglycinamidine synthase I [Candidatus Woesearchaeota archaeon]|nr:phosphoribosylformylglycinamidine synthase I [Candidatus Woesearchaeota archaeon]